MKKKNIETIFINFISELDILLSNGFDVLTAIELYKKSLVSESQAKPFLKALHKIRSGESVTNSLFADEFSSFPSFYQTIFLSAEKSGTFPFAVKQLNIFIKKKESFENQMKRILIYPTLTISVALIALFILLFHFLPSLSLIYKDMNVPLPFLTRTILTVSEKFSILSFLALVLVLGSVFLFLLAPLKRRSLFLKIKPLSFLTQWFQCYFVSFHLYMLLEAGLDFVDAIKILSENTTYSPLFNNILEDIKNGEEADKSFRKHFLLPHYFFESLQLGLASGRLKESCKYLFESAGTKLETNVTYLSSFLEPALIILTAAVVGIIVFLGLYPLLTLSDLTAAL